MFTPLTSDTATTFAESIRKRKPKDSSAESPSPTEHDEGLHPANPEGDKPAERNMLQSMQPLCYNTTKNCNKL